MELASKKGQLTLEYLFLFLILIAVLSISVAAMLSIKEASEKSIQKAEFESKINKLSNIISNVCSLGSENSREFNFDGSLNVESLGEKTIFSSSNFTKIEEFNCEIESATINGKIIVENYKGSIIFRI